MDPNASRVAGAIVLELFSRSRKKNGDWTVNKEFRIAPGQVGSLPDPVDAEAIASILGGQEYYVYTYAASSGVAARKAVPHTLALRLIPMVAATGRLYTRKMSLSGIAAARLGRGRSPGNCGWTCGRTIAINGKSPARCAAAKSAWS